MIVLSSFWRIMYVYIVNHELTVYVENCALLGYYHYLLHNNPEERSCHILHDCMLFMA